MNPVMMQPAECNSVIRVIPLPWIGIPRYNVMSFDSFRASAEPAGEPVPLAHLVRPGGTAVLFDPVLVDVFLMRYGDESPAILALTPVLDAVIAADNVCVADLIASAYRAAFVLPNVSAVGDILRSAH